MGKGIRDRGSGIRDRHRAPRIAGIAGITEREIADPGREAHLM